MNNQKNEKLEKEIEELKSQLNERGQDFCSNYNLLEIKYLCDAFSEYADSNVSIYYDDIDEYYVNHREESNDALIEYGYSLNDFCNLEEATRKGAQIAEYREIYNEVAENEDIFNELIEKMEELKELQKEV